MMTHRENRPRLEDFVYKQSIWDSGETLPGLLHTQVEPHYVQLMCGPNRISLQQDHAFLRPQICTFLPSLAALLPIFLQQRSGSPVDARVLALHLVSKIHIEILQFCSES